MNEIEDRLRDAFHADAETVSPYSLRGLPARGSRGRRPAAARRGPARRSRILAPLTAAAAVTAIAVVTATVGPLVWGSGSGPVASLPAGVPRFYVLSYQNSVSPVVRSTATGQVTGTVRVPRWYYVEDLAPLGGDDSYIALVEPRNGHPGRARLEQFSISNNGRPGALHPLGFPVRVVLPEIAVTPDGHTIVLDSPGGLGSQTRIEVINRLTGQTRTRTDCGCGLINEFPFTLSLSASGRLLALPFRASPVQENDGVRLLPLDSHTRRSRPVPALRNAFFATLSPNGSTVYACLSRQGPHPSTWVAYNIARGHRRTIVSLRGPVYNGFGGCTASASASGRYMLIELGSGRRADVLDIRTGRIIPLPYLFGGDTNGGGVPYW